MHKKWNFAAKVRTDFVLNWDFPPFFFDNNNWNRFMTGSSILILSKLLPLLDISSISEDSNLTENWAHWKWNWSYSKNFIWSARKNCIKCFLPRQAQLFRSVPLSLWRDKSHPRDRLLHCVLFNSNPAHHSIPAMTLPSMHCNAGTNLGT